MPALNESQSERARKNQAAIFQGLSSVGQVKVAEALKVSEGTVSKMKGAEIPQLSEMLAVLGLKVVPQKFQCYEPQTIEAILILAREKLNRLASVTELEWDPE